MLYRSPNNRNRGLDNPGEEIYFEIVIPSEVGQLGIHVVPCDTDGRLIVQGIEPGGRIDRDGRLAVEDAIVAINGYSLKSTSFNKAQEIFKEALFSKELRLRVLKGPRTSEANQGQTACSEDQNEAKTSNKKTEMAAGTKITSAVHANNTRKIGKLLKISLRKGSLGLGFSITTRDNALGGNTPIYIKNILPKGAAIEEGSLKPGDRLLEVNEVCVDGMSQSDVVALLRNVAMDTDVNLVVSRHALVDLEEPQIQPPKAMKLNEPNENEKTDEELMDSLEPQSSMASNATSPGLCSSDNYDDGAASGSGFDSEGFQFPWKEREVLTFDIPVHDSERAGLGVSVKGKTSTSKDGLNVHDLGIFVKSVLHGGAASRDGRLLTNDQLVNINGMSLLGKANPAAMETLRKAMHEEGPVPGIISLTVARRKPDGPPQTQMTRRDSLSSLPTSSDDEIVREYHVSGPGASNRGLPAFKIPASTSSLKSLANSRNPVIDRLMGKTDQNSASLLPSNLRNESYYMATNTTAMDNMGWTGNHSPDSVFLEQPTNFMNNGLDGLQEDDNATVTNENDSQANTGESLTSLVDFYPAPFARDQPGRQSMSEKRHATLDAKSTDTYQKRKKAREEREKAKQLQSWKKSASLESLQLHHEEARRGQRGHDPSMSPYQRANSVRVSRNRGCNESFRAAVDRSYERDLPEAGEAGSAELHEAAKDQVVMRRTKSGGAGSEAKKNRNSKLLRGLGTMFKLGSSSSSNSEAVNSRSMERNKDAKIRKSMPEVPMNSGSSLASTSSNQSQRSHVKSMPPEQPQYVQAPRSHSQPRYRPQPHQEVYEYMPSSMMRPGSRVGIADPTTSESPDYDVLHRLQNTHIQPQQPQFMRQPPPPVPPMHFHQPQGYYAYYNQYGYHQPALPQMAPTAPAHHPRTGSNLSSGGSSTSGPASGGLNGPNKMPRPKSNYYEYDYGSHPSFGASSTTSNSSHFYNSSDHPHAMPHPSMYSLPRSTSGYP